jgi:hypothetical protein
VSDEGIEPSAGAPEAGAPDPDPPAESAADAQSPPVDAPLAGSSAPPPPVRLPPPPAPVAPAPPAQQLAQPGPAASLPAPPPATPVVATRWRSLKGLTTALTVLLWLAAAGALFGVVAFATRINALNDIIDGTLDADTARRAHDADDLVGAAGGILAFLTFVILVLIIIWTYRAAKNNEALARLYPRLKPGWAIAGWLIPLANLVLPVLILQDLWRGSDVATRRGDPAWRLNKGSALIGWYWGVFIASSIRYGVGAPRARLIVTSELRDLRNHDTVALIGMVVTIAAAILAIQVIRRIAARQEECLRAQQAAWTAQP